MLLVFYLTFNVIGAWLQRLLDLGISSLTDVVDHALTARACGILQSTG